MRVISAAFQHMIRVKMGQDSTQLNCLLKQKDGVEQVQKIAEHNILLRQKIELPMGLRLATQEFREGWNLAPKVNAQQMKRKIQTRGWNFIRVADGALRSGVGETSQESIASALKMSLRRINAHFNAVEVEHIELTQYPWFYLARVRIYPYRIQQGTVMPIYDELQPIATDPRPRRLPADSNVLYPYFGSAMPQLKEMLIASRSSQARP
jgi:hypothetical protein